MKREKRKCEESMEEREWWQEWEKEGKKEEIHCKNRLHHGRTRRSMQSRLCIISYSYHLQSTQDSWFGWGGGEVGEGEGCCQRDEIPLTHPLPADSSAHPTETTFCIGLLVSPWKPRMRWIKDRNTERRKNWGNKKKGCGKKKKEL